MPLVSPEIAQLNSTVWSIVHFSNLILSYHTLTEYKTKQKKIDQYLRTFFFATGRSWAVYPQGDTGRYRDSHRHVRRVRAHVRNDPVQRSPYRGEACGVQGGLADPLPGLRG